MKSEISSVKAIIVHPDNKEYDKPTQTSKYKCHCGRFFEDLNKRKCNGILSVIAIATGAFFSYVTINFGTLKSNNLALPAYILLNSVTLGLGTAGLCCIGHCFYKAIKKGCIHKVSDHENSAELAEV